MAQNQYPGRSDGYM